MPRGCMVCRRIVQCSLSLALVTLYATRVHSSSRPHTVPPSQNSRPPTTHDTHTRHRNKTTGQPFLLLSVYRILDIAKLQGVIAHRALQPADPAHVSLRIYGLHFSLSTRVGCAGSEAAASASHKLYLHCPSGTVPQLCCKR